jgi:hypothetical protein
MQIQLTKRFLAAVRKLSAADALAVDAALTELLATFGRPRVHTGRSVRPLRAPVYEMRATLALRIVFVRSGDMLRVDFVGSHGEVSDYLRNSR